MGEGFVGEGFVGEEVVREGFECHSKGSGWERC